MWKKSLANSLVLVMVFSFVATSLAQEDVVADVDVVVDLSANEVGVGEVENAGLLPGNPFYFVKEWGRNLRRAFIFDPVKRAEYELGVVAEKAEELGELVELNSAQEAVEKAAENYEDAMDRVRERLTNLDEMSNNPRIKELLDKLAERGARHEELFEDLKTQVGVLGGALQKARGAWDETIRPTLQGVKDLDDFRNRVMEMVEENNPGYGNMLRMIERAREETKEMFEEQDDGDEGAVAGPKTEDSEDYWTPESMKGAKPVSTETFYLTPGKISEIVPSIQKALKWGASKYEVKPTVCAEIYAPVCGEDGKTYSNECKATVAGVDIASKGECLEEE